MTDYEALFEALKAKASSPVVCPVCGENEWGFPNVRFGLLALDAPPEEVAGEPGDEDDERDGFWPITCLNCGLVRLFHIDTLLGH